MKIVDLVKLVREDVKQEIYPSRKGDNLSQLLDKVDELLVRRQAYFMLIAPGPEPTGEVDLTVWKIRTLLLDSAIERLGGV